MPAQEQIIHAERQLKDVALPPLPSFSLAQLCPACDAPLLRQHCKARCARCGFFWDCSEL